MRSRFKITGFMLLFTAVISILLAGSLQAVSEEVWGLIDESRHEKALMLLEEEDIKDDIDLRFTRALLLSWQGEREESIAEMESLRQLAPDRLDVGLHLIRVLGWESRFSEAEDLAEELLGREENHEIMALLAVQAEWQQNWPAAVERWQQAADMAPEEEQEHNYLNNAERAEDMLTESLTLNMGLSYQDEGPAGYLGKGVESWISPGVSGELQLRISEIGGDSLQPEMAVNLAAAPPRLEEGFRAGGALIYQPYRSQQLTVELGGSYKPADRVILSTEISAAGLPDLSKMELRPGIFYDFGRFGLTLSNTLRRQEEWKPGFSQRALITIPREENILEAELRRFFDDSHQLKLRYHFLSNSGRNDRTILDEIYLRLSENSAGIGGKVTGF